MADILIVDDDDAVAEMLEQRLEILGHTVHRVSNGRDGVDRAFSLRPDLVLMDNQMPTMNGREAVILLRDRGYSGTIVSLSASAMPEELEKAMECGCDANITKPIGRDFESRIQELLENPDG